MAKYSVGDRVSYNRSKFIHADGTIKAVFEKFECTVVWVDPDINSNRVSKQYGIECLDPNFFGHECPVRTNNGWVSMARPGSGWFVEEFQIEPLIFDDGGLWV